MITLVDCNYGNINQTKKKMIEICNRNVLKKQWNWKKKTSKNDLVGRGSFGFATDDYVPPWILHVWCQRLSNWLRSLCIAIRHFLWLYISSRFLSHHRSSLVFDSLLNYNHCVISYIFQILTTHTLDSSLRHLQYKNNVVSIINFSISLSLWQTSTEEMCLNLFSFS